LSKRKKNVIGRQTKAEARNKS